MKISSRLQRLQWENEYENLKGIHLGYTDIVPPVIKTFNDIIKKRGRSNTFNTILDLGCGSGRIGIHLATGGYRVIGIDFVESALGEFARLAKEKGVEERVLLFCQDICKRWDIEDRSIDCIFAITVIEGLTTTGERIHFLSEVLRTLRPGGLLVIEYHLRNDGYYGPLLQASERIEEGILFDPNNGITFKIYSRGEVNALFAQWFNPILEKERTFESIKYGRPYKRRTEIIVFERMGSN